MNPPGRALLPLALVAVFGCDPSADDPPLADAGGLDGGADAMPAADAAPDMTRDDPPDAMPADLDATPGDAGPGPADATHDTTPDATRDAIPRPDGALPDPHFEPIRGRFESAGPVRECGQIARWQAPDGFLLRMRWDVCGDDMAALAATIADNLDAAQARGARALLNISQGPFLPASWTAECQTFHLEDMRFEGDICLPWDAAYQARLRAALVDHIGPAVAGHPALAGVYFTISTMTNGSEMHFRVPRADFDVHPGDAVFEGAYIDVMDLHQQAFDVPILMEVGHCIFSDPPGGAVEPVDCETPRAVYRHARDTYGRGRIGVAVWNCAERFWWGPGAIEDQTRPLLEEAAADGVSFGCQTVANFTDAACRFSDPNVADYGDPIMMPGGDCPAGPSYDPEAACVDTLRWFAGEPGRAPTSVALRGTWAELWSVDVSDRGVYRTSEACRTAADLFAP